MHTTDELGTSAISKRHDYEPYGRIVGEPVADGPGYTGHVSDAATGLSYMQQRYYDPQPGLFLSVDPASTHSGPKHFNRHSYAYGNPCSFNDPDGRVPVMPFIYGAVLGGLADIAAQKVMNPGKPIDKVEVGTAGGVASSAIGRTAGGLAASGAGAAMGDFAPPAARGTPQTPSQSSALGAPNIASTMASTGVAIPRQSVFQGSASQASNNLAGAGATAVQIDLEKKKWVP